MNPHQHYKTPKNMKFYSKQYTLKPWDFCAIEKYRTVGGVDCFLRFATQHITTNAVIEVRKLREGLKNMNISTSFFSTL